MERPNARMPVYSGPRVVRPVARRHKYTAAHKRLRAWAVHALTPECVQCGFRGDLKKLELDHIDPHGPRFEVSNLQWLCKICHGKKTRLGSRSR